MKPAGHRTFVVGLISLLAFAMPAFTAAQVIVQTSQILPPGANTCPILTTQGIVAHVRDGALHSFDVTVGNPTYVAVLAQVGDQTLPFRYMTRFNHGGGFLRHHVDMDTTTIHGAIPVTLTLLSSPAGSPTCISIISFSVAPDGTIVAPGVSGGSVPQTTGGTPHVSMKPTTGGTSQQPTSSYATTSTSTSVSPIDGGVVARLQSLCKGNGALQLWFLLLAIYVVIAALTALAKPPLAQKSPWVPLGLILAPLVVLLCFWYFAPTCRAAGWIPAASIIIAVAALLVAFREQNPGIKVIPLPPAKPAGTSGAAAKPSTQTPMVTKGTASDAKPSMAKAK